MQKEMPNVGDVVHYKSYGTPGGEYRKECRAAIVTARTPFDSVPIHDTMSLCVLNPDGMYFSHRVHQDGSDDPCGGTWHWPCGGQ